VENKPKIKFYEYPLYAVITVILMILAIPILIGRFMLFLTRSTASPLKSGKNFVGFIMVLIIAAAGFIGYKIYIPHSIGQETVSINVSKSDSFAYVLGQLTEKNILHDARLFRIMSVLTGLDKAISQGRYDFSGFVSLKSIYDKFRQKEIATFMVTIPEGQTVWKTASIIAKSTGIDSIDFIDCAFDTSFTMKNYNLEGLEGYLFPETYQFWHQIGAEDIIDIMVKEYFHQIENLQFAGSPNNLSQKDIMILASIIEAEAQDGSELGLISSVYHNRLGQKMLLQADPTVIYALGAMGRPLWYCDLDYDSPYNTYKYSGLPTGPINSPGLAAIKAALHPEESSFLYFVADGSGKHIFSETLEEHNRAKGHIKKFLQVNAAK
jgi:UPF0755 protein